MATTKNEAVEKVTHDPEEYVEFEAFYDGDKYKDDIFVNAGGDRCLVKRGEKVKIKRKHAELIMRSIAQDRNTARMADNLSREFETESKKY